MTARLEAAIEGRDAGAPLESLAPQHLGYQKLRGALRRYREIGATVGWKPIVDANVAPDAIATRLAAERDRDLTQFQQRHGLEPSGQLDLDTLRALAVPINDRVRQIEVNLERWRRMPHDVGKR